MSCLICFVTAHMWHCIASNSSDPASPVIVAMQDAAVNDDRVQGSVLEPCRIGVEMKMKAGTGDFKLSLSDLKLNLAPDILELVQSLQSSVLEPLVQPAPDRSSTILYTSCSRDLTKKYIHLKPFCLSFSNKTRKQYTNCTQPVLS